MSNELIINSAHKGCRIALLKNKNLIEFHYDEVGNQFNVGDIYLGTVRKVVHGLNAAFIDIGYEKDAFLHYLDLGPQVKSLNKFTKLVHGKKNNTLKISNFKLEPLIEKMGKMAQVLTRNQKILVQVVKEPISSKGPRLSCELSIAGRYVILVPFSNVINISKKITNNEERKRLFRLISSIRPENIGVIVRTAAQNKEVAELDGDLRNAMQKWESGMKRLESAQPREKIIGEISRASSIVRDIINESFDNIVIDDKTMFDEVKSYIKTIIPEKEKIVKFYSGKSKIFEHYGIEKQLKLLFGKTVSIPEGGYLIIEHTEALHVIDVNSGNKSNVEKDQEATALNVNLKAAKEIARQLRLRDMGGIIVVDFIDMRKAENRKLVYQKIKEEMKEDRSKFTILPLSKFGLMQITRQRVRPELNISTKEKCPTCDGTGKITASIAVADQIERNLEYIIQKQNEKKVTLVVHPYLYAYFTQGIISKQVKWYFKYMKWLRLEKDSSIGITDFKFLNVVGEEIDINS